jgi:hypothetical protein
VGAAFRITAGERSRVRLPFAGDGSLLDVHVFDEGAGVWTWLSSRVAHDDGWVEAEAVAPGIYALFAGSSVQGGSGSGGRFCGASAEGALFVLALGLLTWLRRR